MDNNGMYTGEQDNGQTNTEQAPNQNYQAPQNNYSQVVNNYNTNMEEPVSIGSWLVTLLIMLIPCVNIVMMFVWAFSAEKKSKQNFFKAYLIYFAIMIVLSIVIVIAAGASIAALMGSITNMGGYYY